MTRICPRSLCTLFVAAGIAIAPAASAMSMLDWSAVTWNPGDLVHTYSFPADGVDVTIRISATGSGTGTFSAWNGFPPETFPCTALATPYKDGSPAPMTYPSDRFGTKLDLGVVFDPGASNNRSVLVQIKFTNLGTGEAGPAKAVSTLKFEISDIDWSGNGTDCVTGLAQGFRQDQVVITANSGTVNPALMAASGTPTFSISGNTATATLNLASNTDDNGTLQVNFGASMVTDVLITYNEAAYNLNTNNNPGYRGIGILGLTMFPVELTDFTVE